LQNKLTNLKANREEWKNMVRHGPQTWGILFFALLYFDTLQFALIYFDLYFFATLYFANLTICPFDLLYLIWKV
jgi:hypothetical protein